MTKFKVTPWEVRGAVDYDRLIKEFGLEPLTEGLIRRVEKLAGSHFMLRRKIFFAHRDLPWLLKKYEEGEKFFLYTGCAPSGPIHIGHLLPWTFAKWLQDKFKVEFWFQFPDEEKFLFKENLTLEDTRHWLYENMYDVIALGLDPKRTHFLIDTMHAGLMYKPACAIAKRITFSSAKATFGFTGATNIGAIFYTAMQAVPAILPSVLAGRNIPCLIPLGVDQDPHFRLARDVYPKLGYYKPAIMHCKFMPGLRGINTKMSSSDPNSTIFTTDPPEVVQEKIKKHAFSGGRGTVAQHRKLGGVPEIDVCYNWLYMFFEPDDRKIEQIYIDYKSGRMLTRELKELTAEKINKFLKSHQAARARAKKQIAKFIYKC